MKRLLAVLLILSLLLGCAVAESAAQPETTHQIEMKSFPLYLAKVDLQVDFPLYFVDGAEDLPFVELNDWKDMLLRLKRAETGESDNGYQLTVQVDETGNTVSFTRESAGNTMAFDFSQGTISFRDYVGFNLEAGAAYMDFSAFPDTDNNGQPFLISRTGLRHLYGDYTVLNLKEYGIPMIAQDGKYLVPLQTLSAFNLSNGGLGMYFNGQVLLVNKIQAMVNPRTGLLQTVLQSGSLPNELVAQIRAFEGTDAEKEAFILEELSKLSDPWPAYVEQYRQQVEESVYAWYNSAPKAMRSQALTDYAYNELCLELNCFYGLKDAHNIKDFRTFMQQSDIGLNLADPDPEKADKAVLDLTQVWFDDGHSGFVSSSWMSENDPEYDYGYSLLGQIGLISAITSARAGHPEAALPYYEVGDTAYVTFDSFAFTPGEVKGVADYYALAESDALPNDTLGIIMQAHKQITRENSPIKNVVLDLSANGGGAVPTAYFTLAWFLGEASFAVHNTFTGAEATSKIKADVNLDRQFDENDTLAGRGLHLFCLTSPKSFSCGNQVPWAFKADGSVILIGKVSGGGSCMVGFNTTAWGTSYQYSSPNQLSFVKNGAYYDLDRGADPDFVIMDYENFYDREALTEFIHSLF